MFKRFWWVFLVMIPAGSIAGLLLAAVVTYVMPKKYESEAVIEVKPRIVDSERASMTPQSFGTEFEEIKSRNSLGKVVDNLELITKWGVDKETAVRILKGIVNTQHIRGTDLISIQVRHTNKEDARDIAAEVARTYRADRVEVDGRDREESLIELTKAIKDQEQKVNERRKVLATLEWSSNGQDYLDAKRDLETDQALLQSMTQDTNSAPEAIKDQENKVNERSKILATLGGVPNAQDQADAKRAMESDLALLQSMKLKQISDANLARLGNDTVVIHEEPQISQVPMSPNVPLNLILGTALGFLLSPVLSLTVILLLSRLVSGKAVPVARGSGA